MPLTPGCGQTSATPAIHRICAALNSVGEQKTTTAKEAENGILLSSSSSWKMEYSVMSTNVCTSMCHQPEKQVVAAVGTGRKSSGPVIQVSQ